MRTISTALQARKQAERCRDVYEAHPVEWLEC
jgi:hypothetical protein